MTARKMFSLTVALAAVASLAGASVACSSLPEPTPTPTPLPAPTPPAAVEGASDQVTVVVASSDLAVGPNRFVFGILDAASSPIRVPEVKASFLYLDTTPYEPRAQVTANFVRWPAGRAGAYILNVPFDQAGRWGVVVEFIAENGTPSIGQAGLVVNSRSASPGIGQPAPLSRNKTARDVSDLSEITTSRVPDPDLYQLTIAEAVSSGRPTMVTFATPAYCQTATCGPQMEVVTSLKERYKGRANFIHVEIYDNVDEIEGDLSNARLSPVVQEWGLVTEPFTFLLDGNGLVSSKFEGFAPESELEAALVTTLGP